MADANPAPTSQSASPANSPSGSPSGSPAGTPSASAPNSTPPSSSPGLSQGTGATAAPDWMSGLNEDMRGFVQNKGWKNPADLTESYRNLEKLVGAPQDKIIKLAADDDAAGWDSIYTRLGRPANPDGYKLEVPKEGGNPEFAKWASNEFFKAGLSEKQAKTLAEGWNQFNQAQGAKAQEAIQAKTTQEMTGLKKEWGAAFDQNLSIAKRAAREFGATPQMIDAVESAIGYAATMKFFNSIGSKIGEASYVAGNGGTAGGNGPLTPDQARAQLNALKSDGDFIKKYVSGDAAARQKMENLQKYAHPDA